MTQASEAEEMVSLDRVLTKLALTDEEKLEKVLSVLLTRVINALCSPHAQCKKKVMEILQHINKRVKDQPHIKLNLPDLVTVYLDATNSMVRNFAIVYVEMGFNRSTDKQKLQEAPRLLTGLSSRPAPHQEMLLRMFVAALPPNGPKGYFGKEEDFAKTYPFLAVPADRKLFLEFARDSLLYGPFVTERAAPTAMDVDGENSPPPSSPPPPGLSRARTKRVLGGQAPLEGEALANRKLAIINFFASAGLQGEEALVHYLVASVDSLQKVSYRGDELYKKRAAHVNLEDSSQIKILMELFLGTTDNSASEETKVVPVGLSLKVKLMGMFAKSEAAANAFPGTLQVIFSCLYGQPSNMTLKTSGMAFAVWVFKHATDAQLKPMGPLILNGLIKLLDGGEATATDADQGMRNLRAFTYQAIGQLGKRMPALLSSSTAMAERFFRALTTEAQGVKASVQESVSSLAAAYKGMPEAISTKLEGILLEGMEGAHEAVRLSAAQWAVRLFPFHHAPARYICILGAGDAKFDVREEAGRGLKPPTDLSAGTPSSKASSVNDVAYPTLTSLLAYAATRLPKLARPADPAEALMLDARSMVAFIEFARKCWHKEYLEMSDGSKPKNVLPELYQQLIEHALVRSGTADLHAAALHSLLEAACVNPSAFAAMYVNRLTWLRGFLSHTNSEARSCASRMLGMVSMALDAHAARELLDTLVAQAASPEDAGQKAGRFEDRDGAISAAGFVLAQGLACNAPPSIEPAAMESAAAALSRILTDRTPHLAAAAACALGFAGLRAALPLPLTAEPATAVPAGADTPTDEKNETEIKEAAKEVARKAPPSRALVGERVLDMLTDKDTKVVLRSISAAGFLLAGDPENAGFRDSLLEGLLKLATSKTEDIQFAVGEALVFVFGGLDLPRENVLYSHFACLSDCTSLHKSASPQAASNDATMQDVNTVQVHFPGTDATRARVMECILNECIFHARAEVRCSGTVWLTNLLKYCGQHAAVQARLSEIHEALSQLLGDNNELTQEMASRGMSLVYELGDEETKKELVGSLVGTLSGTATRKRRAVKVVGETRVFEEGQMGSAPDGKSLSTYQELCSLANEMGQPDLIYRFMDLANNQATLNTRRGAAFGFASIAKLASAQMATHLPSLVPKLYRMQSDPNPKVQEAMGAIWKALVDDPRKALDEHFDAVMKELLKEIGSRQWRNRESSCSALADLMQGRRYNELGPYLSEIWTMMLRAMDDIKDSVRSAAAGLMRTVRGISLRLCDVSMTPHSEAQAAVAVVLPILLKTGILSNVAEIRGLSVEVLMKIVKSTGKEQLRAHMAELVGCMLESLSSLEDTRLNYIEQHAERAGISASKLESARVSASRSSPMADTLELCLRYMDAAMLEEVVPRLTQNVRAGVGLNTRVGTAAFVTSMCTKLGSDIKPFAGKLIQALSEAVRGEPSKAVRKAYAGALAHVGKCAGEKRLARLVEDTIKSYTDPGTPDARHFCGVMLRELSLSAADAFSQQFPLVLPQVFVAQYDEEKDVAALFTEVWEACTTTKSVSMRLYMVELNTVIIQGLKSSNWPCKCRSAEAIKAMAKDAGEALHPHMAELMDALLAELPGRLWDGKEAVLQAVGALALTCKKSPLPSAPAPATIADPTKLVNAVLECVARKKVAFRKAALECLKEVLSGLEAHDMLSLVAPVLVEAASVAPKEKPVPKDAKDDTEKEDENKPLPLVETLQCLAAACRSAGAATLKSHRGEGIALALVEALKMDRPWVARVAALESVEALAKQLQEIKKTDPLSPVHLVEKVLLSVLSCCEDMKISQVRTAALDCVRSVVNAVGDFGALEPALKQSVLQHVENLMMDKSAAVKSLALRVYDELQGAAPMEG